MLSLQPWQLIVVDLLLKVSTNESLVDPNALIVKHWDIWLTNVISCMVTYLGTSSRIKVNRVEVFLLPIMLLLLMLVLRKQLVSLEQNNSNFLLNSQSHFGTHAPHDPAVDAHQVATIITQPYMDFQGYEMSSINSSTNFQKLPHHSLEYSIFFFLTN